MEVTAPAEPSAAAGGKRPSLVIGVALVVIISGVFLTIKTVRDRPTRDATVDGIYLHLDHIEWLEDQMEHHEDYPMPATMMSELPPEGVFRLNVEAALFNKSKEIKSFQVRELFVKCSDKAIWPATGGEVTETIRLGPGELYNIYAHFDIADTQIAENDTLQLLWIRNGRREEMVPISHPPEHFHDRVDIDGSSKRKEPNQWPRSVTGLPAGDPNRGRTSYLSLGCVACHGHPDLPGSNAIGPHLGDIASAASDRVPTQTASQYLYESLLDPDAYIVREARGQPPEGPSAMPSFRDLLNKNSMADLLA